MKKFVNDPKQFVPEFLEGITLASGGTLKYEPKYNLIYRADMPKSDRVSIIQGSGSGHEPAHTMIVGPGMLDAACPGDVFAGPPVEFVTETSKLMDTPAGVLFIVNNYTGDRTAWEMAQGAERGRGPEDRLPARQRRRRREGFDVDRRSPRRRRQLLRHQGSRSEGRQGRHARGVRGGWREGHRQRPDDGHRAVVLYATGSRHAALRDRRRRDGDRDRHPRRARPPASEARSGERDRGHPARRDRARSAVQQRRRGRGHGQRPGRHADQRAVSACTARPTRSSPTRASTCSAAMSASTAPRSRWLARTSRCSRSTTSSRSSCWPPPRSPIACSSAPGGMPGAIRCRGRQPGALGGPSRTGTPI